MATVDSEKVLLVSILSVLAFTASHSLPRDYNPASHEGQKVKGEEGGKQRVDPICSTDDAGHLTCNNLGFCAAIGDPSDKFYHCTANADGSFKMQRCKCTDGYVFSDEDASEPCVKTSSLVDRRERLFFSDESETVLYECGKEDPGTICSTDDAGQFTCLGIGYCAATGDHCDKFYHCIATNDGNYKRENCTCQNGKIFSDDDPEKPCVEGSCDNVFIKNLQPLVSGNDDFVCDPVEETTAQATTTVETTEASTQGTTQEPTWGTTDTTEWTRETTTKMTTTETWSTVTASTSSNVFTTSSPFECQTIGAFPDPEDCHAYYQCVIYPSGVMVTEHCTCDLGQYFDPQNFTCEFGSCNPTQGTTGTPGYSTGSTQYPSTWTPYYTTTTQYFTGTTQHSTEETTTYSPFTCPDLGRFPDPEDCTSYYQCVGDSSGNIHAEHVYCSYGYHFDVVDSLCEEGPCPTKSPYFSTTSPFPTTTAFATESPFECPSLGAYPDPADCRKYFVCRGDSSGNIVASSEHCREGAYFDPNVASCVYGDC